MTNIRRYSNRKLYDERRGRYVSMLELSDLVAGGEAVRVTCDRTGRDLTVLCLARALYERLRYRVEHAPEPFSPEMLTKLFALVRRRPGPRSRREAERVSHG